VYYNLGITFKELEEYQKAISCYEKAIQINPNYADAHNNLGNILQELKELQKAKNCYEKLLNLDPTYKKGYSSYGYLLLKISQHNKGLAYIRKGDGVIRFTQKDVKII
jgi:tetratricopeptide (TPR) repeat protein